MRQGWMQNMRALLFRLAADRRIRYLAVGGLNTVWGYGISLALYYTLSPRWHIVAITTLISVIALTFSFVTYKLFVFRTKGNWLQEYMRCYVVYGGGALLGIAGIWLLVDGLHVPFWLAQGGLMALTVALSYLGHSRFAFVPRRQPDPAPVDKQ